MVVFIPEIKQNASGFHSTRQYHKTEFAAPILTCNPRRYVAIRGATLHWKRTSLLSHSLLSWCVSGVLNVSGPHAMAAGNDPNSKHEEKVDAKWVKHLCVLSPDRNLYGYQKV